MLEPMHTPLPPQTRYDYPFDKTQSYLLQAVFWIPMAYTLYGMRFNSIKGPIVIPIFCLAWVVGMAGLVISKLVEPWVGSHSIRLLKTHGKAERICILRPYFGRKSRELTGGTVELVRTGEVVDLDAPYGICTMKNRSWKQRYEPAWLVLDF